MKRVGNKLWAVYGTRIHIIFASEYNPETIEERHKEEFLGNTVAPSAEKAISNAIWKNDICKHRYVAGYHTDEVYKWEFRAVQVPVPSTSVYVQHKEAQG